MSNTVPYCSINYYSTVLLSILQYNLGIFLKKYVDLVAFAKKGKGSEQIRTSTPKKRVGQILGKRVSDYICHQF